MVWWILILIVLGVPVLGYGYHTPDHFCEPCIADNCGGGNIGDADSMSCVSSSCGEQCRVWMVDRFGSSDACMAQCETVWQSCITASEDSGGLIEDYCVEMARQCFAGCQEDP